SNHTGSASPAKPVKRTQPHIRPAITGLLIQPATSSRPSPELTTDGRLHRIKHRPVGPAPVSERRSGLPMRIRQNPGSIYANEGSPKKKICKRATPPGVLNHHHRHQEPPFVGRP